MRIAGVAYVPGRWDYTDWDGRHYGIAIHCTDNTAADINEAHYAQTRADGTSAHLYVDADSVTQSLPLTARAGHAGSAEGNDNAIAVEITGRTSWSRAKWLASVDWSDLARALAWIIRNDPDFRGFQVRRATVAEMRRNPRVQAFYDHNQMRLAWGGTTHTDPGPNFPFDHLIKVVNAALGKPATTPPKPTTPTTTPTSGGKDMTVKSWDDDVIPLWGTRKTKTNATARVSWVLSAVGSWTEATKSQVTALLAGQSKLLAGQAAILAAVKGGSDAQILARVDHVGEQVVSAVRDAADAAAARNGEMLELFHTYARGEMAADETLRLIGETLIEAAGGADAEDVTTPTVPVGGDTPGGGAPNPGA